MKSAPAYGGRRLSYGPEYIIPAPFDPRLMTTVPIAVAQPPWKPASHASRSSISRPTAPISKAARVREARKARGKQFREGNGSGLAQHRPEIKADRRDASENAAGDAKQP